MEQHPVSKERSSLTMQMLGPEDEQIKSTTINSELSTISQTQETRKVSDKEVDFLIKEMGINRINAITILRRLQLHAAVTLLLNR